MSRLAYIRDVLKFDQSKQVPFTKGVTVRCSQCQALVVCNVPIHESGCPNDTRECRGCNNRVPARQSYCDDCA